MTHMMNAHVCPAPPVDLPPVICNKIEEKNVSMIKRGINSLRFLSLVLHRSIRHTALQRDARRNVCVFDQETRRKRENFPCSVFDERVQMGPINIYTISTGENQSH